MDYNEIAKRYAGLHGYDSIRFSGEHDGYKYFHIYSAASVGHKTGMPKFVKISNQGTPVPVTNLTEAMWATQQEVLLNKL